VNLRDIKIVLYQCIDQTVTGNVCIFAVHCCWVLEATMFRKFCRS